jgi:hypothetical protein
MLMKLISAINFTNILQTAFAPISFHQKITNTNCKHIKALKNTCVHVGKIDTFSLFYNMLLQVTFTPENSLLLSFFFTNNTLHNFTSTLN